MICWPVICWPVICWPGTFWAAPFWVFPSALAGLPIGAGEAASGHADQVESVAVVFHARKRYRGDARMGWILLEPTT